MDSRTNEAGEAFAHRVQKKIIEYRTQEQKMNEMNIATRGYQVIRLQEKISALAAGHRHSANAFSQNIDRAISIGRRVAPEALQAVQAMSHAYEKCAKELDRIASKLEIFTQDQSGVDYAEL